MGINVNYVALYKDTWGQGRIDKTRDIIGMDVKTVNIEVELAGPDFPSEVEVSIRTREPNNKSGGNATVKYPVTVKLPRAGQSKWYLLNLPLNKLGDFMALEKNCNEVTTIVRDKGTADNEFTKTMYTKGWARRGAGKQPASKKEVSGNETLEQPDAYKLIMSGGVEVLEVTVSPQPGAVIKKGTDWGFVRSPSDIVFYSGHGSWGSGYLIKHPSYDFWLDPIDMLEFWGNNTMASCPMDTDCLIINGCNVLYWDVNGQYKLKHEPKDVDYRPNVGLYWADLLCSRYGPLFTILGYRLKAPTDDQAGNWIAREFGKMIANELGTDYSKYAKAWLELNQRNAAYTRDHAAAFDNQGYWFCEKGQIMGPFPLPKTGKY